MSERFNTYFKITGDFLPKQIVDKIELQPDKSQSIKSHNQQVNIKYFSCLIFCACCDTNLRIEEQLVKTIAPLISKTIILKQLSRNYNLQYSLVALPVANYRECMDVSIPNKVKEFLNGTGTKFEMDLPICYVD